MKALSVLLVIVVAATAFLGVRWYVYMANTDTPYDEVGIEINSRLPTPLNRWGGDKLQATFGNVVPPYGCAASDGQSWR